MEDFQYYFYCQFSVFKFTLRSRLLRYLTDLEKAVKVARRLTHLSFCPMYPFSFNFFLIWGIFAEMKKNVLVYVEKIFHWHSGVHWYFGNAYLPWSPVSSKPPGFSIKGKTSSVYHFKDMNLKFISLPKIALKFTSAIWREICLRTLRKWKILISHGVLLQHFLLYHGRLYYIPVHWNHV